MSAFTDKLAALSARERIVLMIGAGAAVAIVLYSLAWQPWQAEISRLGAQVPEKRATLEWMTSQADRIDNLSARAAGDAEESGLPLLMLVERSANQVEIRDLITRMSPGDDADQVRIWMDNADFDRWLRWLETLEGSGIEVAEANIDRAQENRVNIRTTLQR